jgi:glycosyltransferase involved in cell wall biosynthesis
MPSFAEGFGLPVIEALAVGMPVIASDLPAHRETAGDIAVYRPATDAAGWLAEICMFADGSGIASEMRRRVAAYQPTTWGAYFSRSSAFSKHSINSDPYGGRGDRRACRSEYLAP